jgi:hypothetical protein
MRPSRPSPLLFEHHISTGIFTATLESIEEMNASFEPIIAQKVSVVMEAQGQISELNNAEMLPTDWNNWVHARLGDEHGRYSQWINIMRHSLVLTLGSVFEDHLKRMAGSFVAFKKQPPINWRDINKKKGGPRAPRAILIEHGIPQEAFGRNWSVLIDVYEIRNRIAHAGGRHDEKTAPLIAKMSNILCEASDDPKRIHLVDGGIKAICVLMTDTMKSLNAAILSAYRAAK